MGGTLFQFVQLLILANAGVYLACRLLDHDLTRERKFVAGTAFALLYSLPLPFPWIHVLPPLAMWWLLKDPEGESRHRGSVFVAAYFFTAVGTLVVYHLTH